MSSEYFISCYGVSCEGRGAELGFHADRWIGVQLSNRHPLVLGELPKVEILNAAPPPLATAVRRWTLNTPFSRPAIVRQIATCSSVGHKRTKRPFPGRLDLLSDLDALFTLRSIIMICNTGHFHQSDARAAESSKSYP
jgi:hypothetical protein